MNTVESLALKPEGDALLARTTFGDSDASSGVIGSFVRGTEVGYNAVWRCIEGLLQDDLPSNFTRLFVYVFLVDKGVVTLSSTHGQIVRRYYCRVDEDHSERKKRDKN